MAETGAPYYEAMRSTPLGLHLQSQDLPLYWGSMLALHDVPEKSQGTKDSDVLLKQLGGLLGQAQTDLLIVSPYFVPGKPGTEALVAAVQRGARVRIVTNSLASTDVGAVHAGYKKSRRKLLEGGVELFELKPTVDADTQAAGKLSFTGSSAASLHAKTFMIDRQRVFIGSMNLDPRSVQINTEIGILIDNPELARHLENTIGAGLQQACYSVVLEPRNPAKPARRPGTGLDRTTRRPGNPLHDRTADHVLATLQRRLYRDFPGGFPALNPALPIRWRQPMLAP